MAIVKGPALSIAASGNLGAICFSRWRSLQIARDTWTGTVPNTTKQLAQQAIVTTVSQAWGGTLDADQRKTWNNRARTIVWTDRMGDPYIPNGYQLFLKWNIRRQVMSLAIMTTAPPEQEWVEVWAFLLISQAAGTQARIDLRDQNNNAISAYAAEYYKAGPYDSGGRHALEGEYRFLRRQTPPAVWNDLAVIATKYYWYRARQVTEYGDVGNWFEKQIYMKP